MSNVTMDCTPDCKFNHLCIGVRCKASETVKHDCSAPCKNKYSVYVEGKSIHEYIMEADSEAEALERVKKDLEGSMSLDGIQGDDGEDVYEFQGTEDNGQEVISVEKV